MSNKLTPKVILEGTRLTFKTEIAFAFPPMLKVSKQRALRLFI
jgi:hypothetical protein